MDNEENETFRANAFELWAGDVKMTNEVSLDIPADYFQSEESRAHVSRQFQRAINEAYEAGKRAAVEPKRELSNDIGAQIEAGGTGRPYD